MILLHFTALDLGFHKRIFFLLFFFHFIDENHWVFLIGWISLADDYQISVKDD